MRVSTITGHTGLRGLAALCVFIYHLHWEEWFPNSPLQGLSRLAAWPGYAVDLFFILSGFILCHVYSSKINWRQYLVARFARIFPLSIGVVLFCVGLDLYSKVLHGISSENLEPGRIILNLLNLQAWYGNAVANSINPPSWSISVEIFLYIFIFPALYYFCGLKSGRAILLFLCGSLIVLLSLPYLSSYANYPFQALARGSILFAAGFGIKKATLLVTKQPRGYTTVGILSIFIFIALQLIGWHHNFIIYIGLFGIVFFTSFNNSLTAALGIPILEWLGERSYSIYLLHHPIIVFFFRLVLYPHKEADGYSLWIISVTHLLIVILTFLCAEISYRFFECPTREWIRKKLAPLKV
jgi:peptidoglycan/LPS O-acetylase OafA/YrhL